MGGSSSKDQKSTPKHTVVSNKKPTKRVSLLVVHNKDQQPHRHIDNFCKALNTYPPPSSIMINNHDVEFAQVTDGNRLPESEKSQKRNWVTGQLGKGHIVLVWLLVDFDLQSFARGTIFENGYKTIAFRFRKPVVHTNWNCIVVTCKMDDPSSTIRQNMKELAAAIKGDNH